MRIMDNSEIINRLAEEKIMYKKDFLLSQLTNTKTGGIVDVLVYPRNIKEVEVAVKLLKKSKKEFIVLGDMTNVAVASGQLNFNVLCMSKMDKFVKFDNRNNILTVSASYKMKDLAVWALNNSIADLQWMEGIPGTVGAGVFMNAGFLPGEEFRNFMVDVEVLMPSLEVVILKNKDLNFSYRYSELQKNGGIVLSVRLLVRIGKKWKIKIRMAKYHKRRAKNQPLELPSAGTVFIPPVPYHVGAMLPKLGLTGYRIGGAQISTKSPGFIVGINEMSGEDYYKLVRLIQEKIKESYNIDLVPEVRLLGFDSNETE